MIFGPTFFGIITILFGIGIFWALDIGGHSDFSAIYLAVVAIL
jgi:hypothetical protein